jgi:DNA-binding CsgD family transcriptional regulator
LSDHKQISKAIESFAPYAEKLPGVVIIHQLEPFTPCFMTSNGLELLGINKEELLEIGTDYHNRFFNNDDMEDYLMKLDNLLNTSDIKETFTFFQQVKLKAREEWVWHVASTKVFLKNEKDEPSHIITIALPINGLKHIPNKAERLLAENEFYIMNSEKYKSLGKRAKKVLQLVALGKSSQEIAEELFISVETVKSHRKMIKQKLGINSVYEFTLYANAFDLI